MRDLKRKLDEAETMLQEEQKVRERVGREKSGMIQQLSSLEAAASLLQGYLGDLRIKHAMLINRVLEQIKQQYVPLKIEGSKLRRKKLRLVCFSDSVLCTPHSQNNKKK